MAPVIAGQQPSSRTQSTPVPTSLTVEEDLCKKFAELTCGCRKAPSNSPCSNLFSVDHYTELRAQSSFLTKDELDLALMGSIMCTVVKDDWVRDGRHKPTKRRKLTTMIYMHETHEVCKKTFTFLYGIGKDRLRLVKGHYIANGLETRVHGNRKRMPHNYRSPEVINNVVKFLQNYAEENAILLPGRIPGYKRDDMKLLPSSRSKMVSYKIQVVTLILFAFSYLSVNLGHLQRILPQE